MSDLCQAASQDIKDGNEGPRHCASQTVRTGLDYDQENMKDKARAFHTCKMSLARQVFPLFSFSSKPSSRFNGCATLQLSRAQGNFCIVTIEVACQRLGPIYIILLVNVKLFQV